MLYIQTSINGKTFKEKTFKNFEQLLV